MNQIIYNFKMVVIAWGVAAVFLVPASAKSAEIDDAREQSVKILENLQAKKFSIVWDQYVSNWFKHNATKPAFMGNMTIIHTQLGGLSSKRELIEQGESDGDPGSGYVGAVYSFMYETIYPNAKVYESIFLVVDADQYKLAGINYVPNPN